MITARIINGDCVDTMDGMQAGSADFILTDPPYITRYRDRHGRTLAGDDNTAWLEHSYAGMHRVLKADAYAVTFYGWHKLDLFAAAWRKAGFRIGGHIVFRKRYVSKRALLSYRHEQACLLVKGNPPPPASPPDDVIDWRYTGNRLHPTQKPVSALEPLIRAFSKPGDLVLDPFAGSGSTLVAAHRLARHSIGIEIDMAHAATAQARLKRLAPTELRRAA